MDKRGEHYKQEPAPCKLLSSFTGPSWKAQRRKGGEKTGAEERMGKEHERIAAIRKVNELFNEYAEGGCV